MRKFSFLVFLFSVFVNAQMPTYYSKIDFTKSASEIKSQLTTLLKNTHFVKLSYTPRVWEALKDIDADPENPDKVLLIYGYDDTDNDIINDRSRDVDLTCNRVDCPGRWSREHVYPKSIGNFDREGYPYTDIHALKPADSKMNEIRFNYPFMDGIGHSGKVSNFRFYPGDEWKGDVARIIMYMYLRYPDDCSPNFVGDGPNTYSNEIPDIFLKWNVEDPVSDFEIRRNNLIQTKYQGNRNPFIDNPYLATILWGGPKAENRWGSLAVEDKIVEEFNFYPNPTKDKIYYKKDNFTSITIYDMLGRIVNKDLNLADNQTELPKDKGVYFVEFCKPNNCKSYKVIKE